MIDLHCHVDLYPAPKDVIERCRLEQIFVVSVTTTPSAFRGTAALTGQGDPVETALGLHPQLAAQRYCELELFDELLTRVAWVGEIGLDGATEHRSSWQIQERVFEHCLAACASSGGRLLSIHSRLAATNVLGFLRRFPDAGTPILHWFSGTASELREAIGVGCWFSVGSPMLRSKKGRDLVLRIPRERILTETDGPFVQNAGRPAFPWDVDQSELDLSSIWGVPISETRNILDRNLANLTRVPPSRLPL